MKRRRTVTRLGVTIKDLGSCETRNGIAWSAEVSLTIAGTPRTFLVSNDGNGGCDDWTERGADGHAFENVGAAEKILAEYARREPALADVRDCLEHDYAAAGMWIAAALDGCFLIATVSR